MFLLHEMNPARSSYFLNILRQQASEPGKSRLLDVGCGGGLVSERMAAAGYNVTGLDLSLSSLATATRHAASSRMTIAYVNGRAEQLPFANASFDAIVTSDFLEHVGPQLVAVLTEMARVLKPGGLLLYDTINRTFLSRLLVIWGAQLVGRLIPPNVHTWPYLIKPAELVGRMEQVGLASQEIRGLSPRLPKWKVGFYYLQHRQIGGFQLSKDVRLSYIGWAVKPGLY